jgi:hypothetical protein
MLLGDLITQKKELATVIYDNCVRDCSIKKSENQAVICYPPHGIECSIFVFKHENITVSVRCVPSGTFVMIYKQEPYILLAEGELEDLRDLQIGQSIKSAKRA